MKEKKDMIGTEDIVARLTVENMGNEFRFIYLHEPFDR